MSKNRIPSFASSALFTGLFFLILFGFAPVEAESIMVENYQVEYDIDGGTIVYMDMDTDFLELIVGIDSSDDGILELTIPRDLLDAKFDIDDDIFFVLVDGFETEYIELENEVQSRTLLIPFFWGDSQIEIIGTDSLGIGLEEIVGPLVEIPSWVKNNAGWWSQGLISSPDFVSGIQYLITEGIMIIPETQTGQGTTQEIPSWIKNNAGWWADGLIDDSDFVSGIQYLITNGIMKV